MQYLVFTFLLISLLLAADARAGVYIIRPSAGSTCRGGEECTLQWMDDGQSPLLSAFGPSTAGLYTGQMKLVQPLGDVDTSGSRAFTFTVDPKAGPNSDDYYIALASKSLGDMAWSPFFSMANMQGSFESPLPSSSVPPLSTLSLPPPGSTTILSTITVGTLNTFLPSISSTPVEPVRSSSPTPNPSDSSPPLSSATPATPSPTIESASPSTSSSSTPSSSTALASPQAPNVTSAPTSTDVVAAISSRFVTSTLSPSTEATAGSSNDNSSSNAASNSKVLGNSCLSPLLVGAVTLSLVASIL